MKAVGLSKNNQSRKQKTGIRPIKANFSDDGDQDTTRATGSPAGQTAGRPFLSDGRLVAGDIVGDNYEIIELLGVGGMGCVYSARHRILQKIYAMKTINSDAVTETAWRRLQVEAQAIARINHANIVAIHNLGIHQGKLPYYVMDLLSGNNLADLLKDRGPMPLRQAIEIFLQICAGLGFAHKKGIIHRYIKPGNIIILNEADVSGARVKLVDFGIAKLASTSDPNNQNLTTVGEVFGSPFYMSPEQCEGGRLDSRSDIYSVGCTLFETLTGKPPFRGASPLLTMLMHQADDSPTLSSVANQYFPKSIENVLANLLAKKPINRYQTLEHLAEDLQKVLHGEDVTVPRTQAYGDREGYQHESSEQDHLDDLDDLDDYDDYDSDLIVNQPGLKTKKSASRIVATVAALFIVSAGAIFYAATVVQNSRSNAVVGHAGTSTKSMPGASALPIVAGSAVKTELLLPKFSKRYEDRIEFDFPPDMDLGKISDNYSVEKHQPARGKVIIKAGEPVHYFPSDYVIERPQIFNSFAADDLTSVSSPSRMEKGALHEALPYLVRLKSLQRVNLQQTSFSDKDVEYLNQLPNLHVINLNFTKVTGAGFCKFKYLKNLTNLSYSGNKGLDLVLNAIEGSDKLDHLYASGCDAPLGDERAAVLATFKNLQHLDFSASDCNDKTLPYLYGLSHLTFVDLSSCGVTTAAVNKLQAHFGKSLNINREFGPHATMAKFGNESPADWFKLE